MLTGRAVLSRTIAAGKAISTTAQETMKILAKNPPFDLEVPAPDFPEHVQARINAQNSNRPSEIVGAQVIIKALNQHGQSTPFASNTTTTKDEHAYIRNGS